MTRRGRLSRPDDARIRARTVRVGSHDAERSLTIFEDTLLRRAKRTSEAATSGLNTAGEEKTPTGDRSVAHFFVKEDGRTRESKRFSWSSHQTRNGRRAHRIATSTANPHHRHVHRDHAHPYPPPAKDDRAPPPARRARPRVPSPPRHLGRHDKRVGRSGRGVRHVRCGPLHRHDHGRGHGDDVSGIRWR